MVMDNAARNKCHLMVQSSEILFHPLANTVFLRYTIFFFSATFFSNENIRKIGTQIEAMANS